MVKHDIIFGEGEATSKLRGCPKSDSHKIIWEIFLLINVIKVYCTKDEHNIHGHQVFFSFFKRFIKNAIV